MNPCMKLRTLIIDDEPIALEKLKNYVGRVPALELSAMCRDGFEALEYIEKNKVDLIITDINMPDLSGLDFVKTLHEPPLVIFTTAHAGYAVDSYSVSAIDYLLKPYGFVEFTRAVNKAVETYMLRQGGGSAESRIASRTADSIFVKVDYRFIRVRLPEMLYIKGYGEYLQIFVEGKPGPLVTLSSFAAIKEGLSGNFLQVHRSYIVNMDHVDQIERARLIIDDGTAIPVGDSYKTILQEYLSAHSVGRTAK